MGLVGAGRIMPPATRRASRRRSQGVSHARFGHPRGARTPIGKLSGALAGFTAMELGGFAIAAALERAGVAPSDVDYVFMGQVLQAGQGQITARQAAVNGGIPMTVPATTINKVCLSGPQRHLPRGPPDPLGRGRRRRRGRDGVDDQRPAPAPGGRAPATGSVTGRSSTR